MHLFRKYFFLIAVLAPFAGTASPFVHDSIVIANSFSSKAKQREVRNYIRPCVYVNYFTTGERIIRPVKPGINQVAITNVLGKYKFSEGNLGFYCPLYTHTHFSSDSTDVNTFHLLMTFNGLNDRPQFSNLPKQHQLYKMGLGIRGIYAFRSQFILFADLSPYVTGDKYDTHLTQQYHLAGSVVFNWMVSPAFSMRAGITRTFIWGNRWILPMAGIRVGRLDGKCYFSMQFPRYTSLTFQPSPKFSFSLYSRAYGGLYNISNADSLYIGRDSVIQLGQTGLANGIRFDFRPSPNFSFFVSTGYAVRNHIWLYSWSFNDQLHPINSFGPFYNGNPAPTGFVQLGMTWRFGKAKKSAGNYLMYDVFQMNNDMDPGDNNNGPGNGNIPGGYDKKKEMNKVQYKDVIDLVDDTDLY
ncbi:MAG: hypothetical protein HY064_14615 [Bacteroidetes bacterium]|nr:hypothetical protein [Bacteroidota bacterium]